ncbi:hypothetical protein [Sandaracinus amylolyticus]|uniref:Uncharacterized protein n=1 Tax=Sandaracinus amylolyticus TaxID=927083 RepID=A0A0F6W4X1_9BACT|nr:hypothetical protein [Sandaracinus amylolyticus]AKF07511.1 hypothetical protein DB32_004660 [Sandaracinus amylolyticus]
MRCPLQWDALERTDDPDVRHCTACSERVYFCRDDAETVERALAGQCIAREEPDASEKPAIVLGRPARPLVMTARQSAAQSWSGRERGIREAIAGDVRATRRCPECGYPVAGWREHCYVCGHALGRAP